MRWLRNTGKNSQCLRGVRGVFNNISRHFYSLVNKRACSINSFSSKGGFWYQRLWEYSNNGHISSLMRQGLSLKWLWCFHELNSHIFKNNHKSNTINHTYTLEKTKSLAEKRDEDYWGWAATEDGIEVLYAMSLGEDPIRSSTVWTLRSNNKGFLIFACAVISLSMTRVDRSLLSCWMTATPWILLDSDDHSCL